MRQIRLNLKIAEWIALRIPEQRQHSSQEAEADLFFVFN